jgi:hypothetical protein
MPATTESIILQVTEDPNLRIFNVRAELTEKKVEDGCIGDPSDLGAFGRLILGIRGIEVVRVQTYRIFVSKAVMFSWDEIQPKVVDVLTCFVKSNEMLHSLELPIVG